MSFRLYEMKTLALHLPVSNAAALAIGMLLAGVPIFGAWQ
jgi:hypothetical protein